MKRFSPSEGNVKALGMTLAAFKEMTTITGNDFNFGIFSDDIVYL